MKMEQKQQKPESVTKVIASGGTFQIELVLTTQFLRGSKYNEKNNKLTISFLLPVHVDHIRSSTGIES